MIPQEAEREEDDDDDEAEEANGKEERIRQSPWSSPNFQIMHIDSLGI